MPIHISGHSGKTAEEKVPIFLCSCSDRGFGLQDIRTWSVVWEVSQTCRTFGCCYLPGAANALAVCGPANCVSIYDTSAGNPESEAHAHPSHMLHESKAIPERNLLCVAASPDGSSIAASGMAHPVAVSWLCSFMLFVGQGTLRPPQHLYLYKLRSGAHS